MGWCWGCKETKAVLSSSSALHFTNPSLCLPLLTWKTHLFHNQQPELLLTSRTSNMWFGQWENGLPQPCQRTGVNTALLGCRWSRGFLTSKLLEFRCIHSSQGFSFLYAIDWSQVLITTSPQYSTRVTPTTVTLLDTLEEVINKHNNWKEGRPNWWSIVYAWDNTKNDSKK